MVDLSQAAAGAEDKTYSVERIEHVIVSMCSLMETHEKQHQTMCELMLAFAQRVEIPLNQRVIIHKSWGAPDQVLILEFPKFELIFPITMKLDLLAACRGEKPGVRVLAQAIIMPVGDGWTGFCRKRMFFNATQKGARNSAAERIYAI